MKSLITNSSPRKAALLVGVSFITSVIIVTIVDDVLLANFVVPGDPSALARDMEANRTSFGFATAGYLLVLLLDALIGLSLYVVLKPANKQLAWYAGVLRLLYAGTLILAVFALIFQMIDVYRYASLKLFGYVFFALHLLVLGYAVFKSGYMPRILGILLIFTSLTYTVFFIDSSNLQEVLLVSLMLIMLMGELTLSIWLIIKRNSLPEYP